MTDPQDPASGGPHDQQPGPPPGPHPGHTPGPPQPPGSAQSPGPQQPLWQQNPAQQNPQQPPWQAGPPPQQPWQQPVPGQGYRPQPGPGQGYPPQPGPGQAWQAGPPGYGPGGPQPKRRTGKIVAIGLGVAAVLAGGGVGIAAALGAFSSDDGSVSSSSEPDEVFHAMLDAANSGESEEFLSLLCREDRDAVEQEMAAQGLETDELFPASGNVLTLHAEVTDVSIDPDGERATITFDGITKWSDGDTETDPDEIQEMVKEDGSWKAC